MDLNRIAEGAAILSVGIIIGFCLLAESIKTTNVDRRVCLLYGNDASDGEVVSHKKHASNRIIKADDFDYKDDATFNLQPTITTIEGYPARKGFSSISFPNGSIWCDGRPTFWITGHQRENESPYCKVRGGRWVLNNSVEMDVSDVMNGLEIDRHYCVTMDVNGDGLPDIICSFGANEGKGMGYNELYLTNMNGTITKVQRYHGLQAYPTMRNRFTVTLKNASDMPSFVFFATLGHHRKDGGANGHHMFRNDYRGENKFPYFFEVPGPWQERGAFEASCAVAGDFDGDRLDDLIVCAKEGRPILVKQLDDGTFSPVELPKTEVTKNWRNVRIVDVTGDGVSDLVVVTEGQPSNLYIFRGKTTRRNNRQQHYLNFNGIYFHKKLEWASPNVEVLDVNKDKNADIYVVQTDERSAYCGEGNANTFWGGGTQPPIAWTPPRDKAQDLLLMGTGIETDPFKQVDLYHSEPGCGWIAQRWDDNTMLLGQGTWDAAGHSLLLEW